MEADAEATFYQSEKTKYHSAESKLFKIVYSSDDKTRDELNRVLDELNAVEYKLNIVSEQNVSKLLCRCCYLVPVNDDHLVSKVCNLINNLLGRQEIILTTEADIVMEFVLRALEKCQSWSKVDVLQALAGILYMNSGNLSQFYDKLIGDEGILLQLLNIEETDVVAWANNCLEKLCFRSSDDVYLSNYQQSVCLKAFLRTLHTPKPQSRDDSMHGRIIYHAFLGIYHIQETLNIFPCELYGPLLAAIRSYMFYGVSTQSPSVPDSLYQSPLLPASLMPEPKATNKESLDVTEVGDSQTPIRKKKANKGRKGRNTPRKENRANDDLAVGLDRINVSHSTPRKQGQLRRSNRTTPMRQATYSGDMQSVDHSWIQFSSSESDFSDVEGSFQGGHNSNRNCFTKVRTKALACFVLLCKIDNRTMFGYWTSFLPESTGFGGPPQGQNLFTVILRDPSPKVRTWALVAISSLMDGSKIFLQAASDVDVGRQAYTPLTATLGVMVKEIHRCLLMALVSENFPQALNQVLKGLSILVSMVPYGKFRPGLLSKVVKNAKPYLAHRDPNIRVGALTLVGSVVSVDAPLAEVWHLLHASGSSLRQSRISSTGERFHESGYQSNEAHTPRTEGAGSGSCTPQELPSNNLPSGTLTPTVFDQLASSDEVETSWIIRLCIDNIIPGLYDVLIKRQPKEELQLPTRHKLPHVPVRVESLQLLSRLAKWYFSAIKQCFTVIGDLICVTLEDSDENIVYQAIKFLTEVGTSIIRLQESTKTDSQPPELAQVIEFWIKLLNGPLPNVIQNTTDYNIRSCACESFTTIGVKTFEMLPQDKRILCITLMLGMTANEHKVERGQAIRALGVYIMYPSMREDVSFVADVANVIIKTLDEDQNFVCRYNATWTLANLADAIATNRANGDLIFMEEFSDMLLLKMFEVAMRSTKDKEKVKSNCVRALGNLLRYLPRRCYDNDRFSKVIGDSILCISKIIKSTPHNKARWNACYAIKHIFSNDVIQFDKEPYTADVVSALAHAVHECNNLKVRIHAASALEIWPNRAFYSDLFGDVCNALIRGLVNSESISDFGEYKFLENYQTQAISSLAHMIKIITVEDLIVVGHVLTSYAENVKECLERYHRLVSTSRASEDLDGDRKSWTSVKQILTDVEVKLEDCGKEKLTHEQEKALEVILTVFISPLQGHTLKEEPEEQDSPFRPGSPRSSFKQSYD